MRVAAISKGATPMFRSKVRAALVSLLLIIAATLTAVVVATPAQAGQATQCRDAFGIRPCVTLSWSNFNVKLNNVSHYTDTGCYKLEADGGRYSYKDVSTPKAYYHYGAQGCSGSVDILNDACSGCTTRKIVVYMKARVQWEYDYEYTFTFYLRSDGSWGGNTDVYVGPCC